MELKTLVAPLIITYRTDQHAALAANKYGATD